MPAERAAPGPLRKMLYWVAWFLTQGLFRAWFGLRVSGRPYPFPRGPLVVAANHCSYLDPILLGLAVPRRITYLVTSNVFDLPRYRPWMWLFGAIRVDVGARNVGAVRAAIAALRRGGVVGIFPEGGISDDGRLREGGLGVASLLIQGDAPVLTAGLLGSFEALPRGGGFPRRRRLQVVFSGIVKPAAAVAGASPREARRLLRDAVMASIARALPPSMQPTVPAGPSALSAPST